MRLKWSRAAVAMIVTSCAWMTSASARPPASSETRQPGNSGYAEMIAELEAVNLADLNGYAGKRPTASARESESIFGKHDA